MEPTAQPSQQQLVHRRARGARRLCPAPRVTELLAGKPEPDSSPKRFLPPGSWVRCGAGAWEGGRSCGRERVRSRGESRRHGNGEVSAGHGARGAWAEGRGPGHVVCPHFGGVRRKQNVRRMPTRIKAAVS